MNYRYDFGGVSYVLNEKNALKSHVYETGLVCKNNDYKEPNLHKWGPGVRDVYALHYIISGKGSLKTDDQVYEIHAGDVFLIFPNTEMSYYPDADEPWEYIWVDFCGDKAADYVSMTGFTKQLPVIREKREVKPYFHIFDGEPNPLAKRDRYNAKLRVLLTYFYADDQHESPPRENAYISMAMDYIESHYWKSSFNVTSIVKYLNIDRTYLFRLFKKTTGISMVRCLTDYRIKKACNLLLTTELSIKAVACSAGFGDPLYFSRVFHRVMHMCPSSYRKSVQLPLSR